MNDSTHWRRVYAERPAQQLSWFQADPALSLALIDRSGVGKEAPILDVGAGAGTLIDALLARGFRDLTALDVAENALAQIEAPLAHAGAKVAFIAADVTAWRARRRYALWHDRAMLHFLTEPQQQLGYAESLRAALAPGGFAIIAGFAPGGPVRCSGLPIVQHDDESLAAILGPDFTLIAAQDERHVTPAAARQAFRYRLWRRS